MPLPPAATPNSSDSTSNPGSASATSNNTTTSQGTANIASTAPHLNYGSTMSARSAQASSGSGVDIPASARRALPGVKSSRSVYVLLTALRRRDASIATADHPWSRSTSNADAPTSCTFSRRASVSARTRLECTPRRTGSARSANCPNTGSQDRKSVYPAKTRVTVPLRSTTHRKKGVIAIQKTHTAMRREIVSLVHYLGSGTANRKSAYVPPTTSGTTISKNVSVRHLTPSIS